VILSVEVREPLSERPSISSKMLLGGAEVSEQNMEGGFESAQDSLNCVLILRFRTVLKCCSTFEPGVSLSLTVIAPLEKLHAATCLAERSGSCLPGQLCQIACYENRLLLQRVVANAF
jgi:hypothetical protein